MLVMRQKFLNSKLCLHIEGTEMEKNKKESSYNEAEGPKDCGDSLPGQTEEQIPSDKQPATPGSTPYRIPMGNVDGELTEEQRKF